MTKFAQFCFVLLSLPVAGLSQTALKYAPAPADNPLRGFVPYVKTDQWERFPHSMEFHYFALNDLMQGYESFDWSPIETILMTTQERGCQLIFRVMMEYPNRGVLVPQFLIDEGVKITEWESKESDSGKCHTPDYEDPRLRRALVAFVAALGKKYDGDPRVGYLTAGLLGLWGEWHNYPREELGASKETEALVLDAYEKAFLKTPVLLRYPAGDNHYAHAANQLRPFGYHDDSFNWATLDTGREEDTWYFIPLLKAAGATEKWKTQPIGGELRPELWKTSFTETPHRRSQGFEACVRKTHATWLMDSGLFEKRIPLPESRKRNAIKAAQLLGYEFFVSEWQVVADEIRITVENRGVAPFYHDWPVELEAGGESIASFDLRGILPGDVKTWIAKVASEGVEYRLRVPNPMAGGKPLRFANAEQGDEWLVLP
ncbi:hypothetical protein VSU19_16760 [Verrucomicrobiales bacterium BCK34]|nr:hypothetical protein [Verrucomicrobiales bacterium BCK34]